MYRLCSLVPSVVAAVVDVFEPFESADSFGVTRICWDATLLEGVLTHLWDGGIHSSLLLNLQMLFDFGQVLLGCYMWDGIHSHPSMVVRGFGSLCFSPLRLRRIVLLPRLGKSQVW